MFSARNPRRPPRRREVVPKREQRDSDHGDRNVLISISRLGLTSTATIKPSYKFTITPWCTTSPLVRVFLSYILSYIYIYIFCLFFCFVDGDEGWEILWINVSDICIDTLFCTLQIIYCILRVLKKILFNFLNISKYFICSFLSEVLLISSISRCTKDFYFHQMMKKFAYSFCFL